MFKSNAGQESIGFHPYVPVTFCELCQAIFAVADGSDVARLPSVISANSVLQKIDEVCGCGFVIDKFGISRYRSDFSGSKFFSVETAFDKSNFVFEGGVKPFDAIAMKFVIGNHDACLIPRGQKELADRSVKLTDVVTADGQDFMELTLLANIAGFFAAIRKVVGNEEGLGHVGLNDSHQAMLSIDEDAIDIEGDGIGAELPRVSLHDFCPALNGSLRGLAVSSVGTEPLCGHFRRDEDDFSLDEIGIHGNE